MKLSTLLSIDAIVSAVFGLTFVLVPETVMSFYGVTLSWTLSIGQSFRNSEYNISSA